MFVYYMQQTYKLIVVSKNLVSYLYIIGKELKGRQILFLFLFFPSDENKDCVKGNLETNQKLRKKNTLNPHFRNESIVSI